MIRINLLPIKQARKRQYGQQQLILFLFLLILEGAVLYTVLGSKREERDRLAEEVETARGELAEVNELQGQIDQLSGQLADLILVGEMLEDLQANRVGPVGPLQELQYILNMWDSARTRAEQETQGWHTNMDPRRVWLNSISVSSSSFSVSGLGRTGEDVAEFLLRLESHRPDTDPFFIQPQISSISDQSDPYFGVAQGFSISGGVRYHPMALEFD